MLESERFLREMSAKYKILWFVVDMHHGQRYFFRSLSRNLGFWAGLKGRPAFQGKSDPFSFHWPVNWREAILAPFPGRNANDFQRKEKVYGLVSKHLRPDVQ